MVEAEILDGLDHAGLHGGDDAKALVLGHVPTYMWHMTHTTTPPHKEMVRDRVAELLAANNREVEARRALQRHVEALTATVAAQGAALAKARSDIERVIVDAAAALSCKPDNEAILAGIGGLCALHSAVVDFFGYRPHSGHEAHARYVTSARLLNEAALYGLRYTTNTTKCKHYYITKY